MDSDNNNIAYRDNENTFDFDLSENNEPHNVLTKRKTLEEPIKEFTEESTRELAMKKIRVNITKPKENNRSSVVWKYFEEENGHNFCKIIVLKKKEKVECGTNYKH